MLRRILTVALLAATIGTTPAHALPVPHSSWRWDECRFRSLHAAHPPAFTHRETKLIIRCAVWHWPVVGGAAKAIDVAECESSLFPHALSPSGTYKGIFQMGDGEFESQFRSHPHIMERWKVREDIFNARSNIIAAILMAHAGGWGPWTCA